MYIVKYNLDGRIQRYRARVVYVSSTDFFGNIDPLSVTLRLEQLYHLRGQRLTVEFLGPENDSFDRR